jgi:hypothetical protein
MLVQNQLGDEPFQAIDVAFQLAAPAIGIDLFGIVVLTPPVIGGFRNTLFAANVRNRQSFGQVAVGFAQQPCHFLGGPSPFHESLRASCYRKTLISTGPIFGAQAIEFATSQLNHLTRSHPGESLQFDHRPEHR